MPTPPASPNFRSEEKFAAPHHSIPYLPLREAVTTLVFMTSRRRIGRNDQCPCGSGWKYKRCCLPRGLTISSEIGLSAELTFNQGDIQRLPTDKMQAGVLPVVLVFRNPQAFTLHCCRRAS
jgi:hypothetical protein